MRPRVPRRPRCPARAAPVSGLCLLATLVALIACASNREGDRLARCGSLAQGGGTDSGGCGPAPSTTPGDRGAAESSTRPWRVGDRVVLVGQGVFQVVSREPLRDAPVPQGQVLTSSAGLAPPSAKSEVLVLRAESNGVTAIVPVGGSSVRPLVTPEHADRLLALLRERPSAEPELPWNPTYRRLMAMTMSGDPDGLARALAFLGARARTRPLSFGERRLFELLEGQLVEELGTVKRLPSAQVEQQVRQAIALDQP